MAQLLTYDEYEITNSGETYSFDLSGNEDIYRIYTSSAVTLLNDMVFSVTGTPVIGNTIRILYEADVTPNGHLLRFLGQDLINEQGESRLEILCFYNGTNWILVFEPSVGPNNQSINGNQILDGTVANVSLAGAIDVNKLATSTRGYLIRAGASGIKEEFQAKTSGYLVMGDGTDVKSQVVTGDVTINGSGVTSIGNSKITTAMVTNSNITVAKLESSAQLELITLPVSFETGELTSYKIRMPYPGTLTYIYAECTKAIANTDNGSITPKNNAGTSMTVTTPIVFTASDPLTTAYSSAVTSNNTFIAGDVLTFLTAKATAGGKVLLSLTIQRS